MRSSGSILRNAIVVAVVASSATGCFRATLRDTRSPVVERHDIWVDEYVFGLIGGEDVDVRYFCANGAARVGVFESAATWTATVLSLGMYTPRVATIACAAPASAERAQ